MPKYERFLFIWDSKGSRVGMNEFLSLAAHYMQFLVDNETALYPRVISSPNPEFTQDEGEGDIVALYADVPEGTDPHVMQLIFFGRLACDAWIIDGSTSWYFKIERSWKIC